MCVKGKTREVIIDGKSISIDKCISRIIRGMNNDGIKTLASCCGHGKYPTTIIVKKEAVKTISFEIKERIYDFCSGITVPRKRKFYKKDGEGYYYLPEHCIRVD